MPNTWRPASAAPAHRLEAFTMLTDRRLAASGSSVPVRCSDCMLPFDPRDAHRQMRTLDGPLALCSDCTWRLEHPGDIRRA